jgi:fluoride ion exporter CrcB/FEX
MKRRLYPVVKHCARFAIITAFLAPVITLGMTTIYSRGNVGAAARFLVNSWWPLKPKERTALVIYVADTVALTFVIGRLQFVRQRRRLAAIQAAPKPSAPLLAAGDQGAGGKAG